MAVGNAAKSLVSSRVLERAITAVSLCARLNRIIWRVRSHQLGGTTLPAQASPIALRVQITRRWWLVRMASQGMILSLCAHTAYPT